MRIARWEYPVVERAEGETKRIGEGFVIGESVVAFPDGRTVADVLAGI